VLRLLVLKHMRNWSYGVLEREVRAKASTSSPRAPKISP
jgi:hypothetical protein